jgi:hypothetical protein
MEGQKESDDEENNSAVEIGDILEVTKTKNPKNANEYMIITNKGMFFITINYELK